MVMLSKLLCELMQACIDDHQRYCMVHCSPILASGSRHHLNSSPSMSDSFGADMCCTSRELSFFNKRAPSISGASTAIYGTLFPVHIFIKSALYIPLSVPTWLHMSNARAKTADIRRSYQLPSQ